MTDAHTAPELEDEQEVDLSSAWQRLKVRWWLPIGGLLVGAVIGLALALSGGSVWRAQTIVYLGQPFAPLGGGQIQSLATNPRTVGEIIRSESALKDASRQERHPGVAASLVDLDARAPRGRAAPRHQPADRDRGEGLRQAKGRAARPTCSPNVSPSAFRVYVTEKVELLERQVEVAEAQLAAVEARIADCPGAAGRPHHRHVDPARPATAPVART